MKDEFKIFFFVSLFVLFIGLIFFFSKGITGKVIQGEEFENGTSAADIVYVELDAIYAIEDIKGFISELDGRNFQHSYFDDVLIECEILLGENLFKDVMNKKNELEERLILTYEIYDNLLLFENSISQYAEEGINVVEAREKFILLEKSFFEERYGEAEIILEDLRNIIEESRSEANILSILNSNLKNFFVKNWDYILGIVFFAILFTWIILIINSKRILKKKIKKMKSEEKVLNKLIMKTQGDRFNRGSISGLVYNIRIKKYKDRLSDISQRLPVLEDKLNKKTKVKEVKPIRVRRVRVVKKK